MTLLDKVLCRPCVFCEIVQGNLPSRLLYKDDEIAAFQDINPSAETHILVIPIEHIRNIKFVTTDHIGLLEKMRRKAIDLLKERGHEPEASKLGFHVPPFHSIDHLHLHALGGEMKSKFRKLKYESGKLWYMDIHDLQADLDKKLRTQQGARL